MKTSIDIRDVHVGHLTPERGFSIYGQQCSFYCGIVFAI